MSLRKRLRPARWLRATAATTAGVLAIAGAPVGATVDDNSADTAIEARVLGQLTDGGTATFWVYLDDEADLASAARLTDRRARGRSVHQRLRETAATSQADLIDLLDHAGADYESFWIANTVKVTGDADLLHQVADLPQVEQITTDSEYDLPEMMPAQAESLVDGVEWGVERIGAVDVWNTYGVTGQDIVVGSIDTGVQYDHPALVNQYRGTRDDGTVDHDYNWWDPTGICGATPCDNNGHGTHTTGTMVGDDGADNHVGVAPGARWIAAKGCEGARCSQASLLSAGQFMLAPTDVNGNNPDPDKRPHVINNSWGGAVRDDPWYHATVDAWIAAGIFPQFSNGNDGPACRTAGNPGNAPGTYAAGAFDVDNVIADFSSRGPSAWGDETKPNIAAPGVAVRSSYPDHRYATGSGTSMASPHVAGAVALLWSAAPELARDVDATRLLLGRTAVDVADLTCGGAEEDNNVWGEGRLDVAAAVQSAPMGPTGVLRGTVTGSDSGLPIEEAVLDIAGTARRRTTSGPSGDVEIILPVGAYTVDATAFGYEQLRLDVTITEDAVTTVDVALPVPDGPRLAITPDDGDFGVVPVGTTGGPIEVTLTAAGGTASTVTGRAEEQDRFILSGGTCGSPPITLARFEQCTLHYTFRPIVGGPASTTMTFESNQPGAHHELELVGHAATLPARIGAGDVLSDTSQLPSAVVDPAGTFAYFGTQTSPGQIVKVELETLEHVDTLTLGIGQNNVQSAVIDPSGQFAYFGTQTGPGRIVKIDLETFTQVGEIILPSGENSLRAAAIDPNGRNAYFITAVGDSRVVKIDLETFERVDSAALDALVLSAAIEPDGRYAYFATFESPGRLVKFDLAAFAPVDVLALDSGDDVVSTIVLDPTGDFAYLGTNTRPAQVVKVDLATLDKVAGITLDEGENQIRTAIMHPSGEFAVVATGTSPTTVVTIDLDPFQRIAGQTMADGDDNPLSAVIDPLGRYAYVGVSSSPAQVVKVQVAVTFDAAAVGSRVRGKHSAALTWNGSLSELVDVFRDGDLIATVANTGTHTDAITVHGRPTYVYRLCDAGTDRCSNETTVDFTSPPPTQPPS